MRFLGPAAMIGLCLAVFGLSMQAGARYGLINALSLSIGSVALVAMSLCLLLAARPGVLEPFFGGLDRMYHFHKWSGIAALGAIILHEQAEPDVEDYARETLMGEVGASVGEVAYSSRTAAEVIGREVLAEAAEQFPNFSFDLIVTETDGRLDAARVIAGVPFDANGADFFFCGPANLRAAILKGLETQGITQRETYFEMFEFR